MKINIDDYIGEEFKLLLPARAVEEGDSWWTVAESLAEPRPEATWKANVRHGSRCSESSLMSSLVSPCYGGKVITERLTTEQAGLNNFWKLPLSNF